MKILTTGFLTLCFLLSSCLSAQGRTYSNDQFLDFLEKSSPLGLTDLDALDRVGQPLDVSKDGCGLKLEGGTTITGDSWVYGARKNGAQSQLQLCVYKRHVISYVAEQLSGSGGKSVWAQLQITDNSLAQLLFEDKTKEENQKPEEILEGGKFFI